MNVEGRSPEDPWIRRSKRSRPCQGVALSAYSSSEAPWRGRISLSGSSFPGSSALRASTPGLKSDDPSGATPLRDRQTQWYPVKSAFILAVMLKCTTPGIGEAEDHPCLLIGLIDHLRAPRQGKSHHTDYQQVDMRHFYYRY